MLADFLLHKMFTSRDLDGIVAIELGAGTGKVNVYLVGSPALVMMQSIF